LEDTLESADAGSSVKRFVVLQHDVGSQLDRTTEVHLDWMFVTGETLSTWSTEVITSFENSFEKPCLKLAEHRLIYLDHEGELGGGRGSVRRIIAGEYTPVASTSPEVAFKAMLCWQIDSGVRHAEVEIGQARADSGSEREPIFYLRFSSGR
jgi:hypothetical protein